MLSENQAPQKFRETEPLGSLLVSLFINIFRFSMCFDSESDNLWRASPISSAALNLTRPSTHTLDLKHRKCPVRLKSSEALDSHLPQGITDALTFTAIPSSDGPQGNLICSYRHTWALSGAPRVLHWPQQTCMDRDVHCILDDCKTSHDGFIGRTPWPCHHPGLRTLIVGTHYRHSLPCPIFDNGAPLIIGSPRWHIQHELPGAVEEKSPTPSHPPAEHQ